MPKLASMERHRSRGVLRLIFGLFSQGIGNMAFSLLLFGPCLPLFFLSLDLRFVPATEPSLLARLRGHGLGESVLRDAGAEADRPERLAFLDRRQLGLGREL